MIDISLAVKLEGSDRIVEAADAYEKILADGDFSFDAIFNLTFLYWQVSEFGFHASLGLSDDFVRRSWRRHDELMGELERRYPGNPEVRFWALYFPYAAIGGPDFVGECEALAENCSSLVPYFYLYSSAGGLRYKEEADRLLRLSESSPTLKNRYIASIIRATRTLSEAE